MNQKNAKLFVILLSLGLVILSLGGSLPAYTKLALVFLILPTIFVYFKHGGHLDKKKLLVTSLLAIFATIVWDNIAINLKIWDFPKENVIGWLLGVPIEEYFFGFWIVAMSIGIYTALHKQKSVINIPHLKTLTLLILTTLAQFAVLFFIFFYNANSYIKWLLVLAIIPSFFFVFRKGERIDYIKMFITALIMGLITIVYDHIFIPGSWYHYDSAIIGRIWGVPIDDILFSFFTSITIIGFYTSVPHKHPFIGKWGQN